jgi:hypothetical protein
VILLSYVVLVGLIDVLPYPRDKIESSGANYVLTTDREELDMSEPRIVESHSDGSVTVTMDVEIKVGRWLRINPSEAFMGIEPGVVKIAGILHHTKLDNEEVYVDGINTEELIHMIEVHKDGVLDLMEGTEYYGEELDKLDNGIWVVYQYQRNDGWNVLPLEEFVGHTMHY